MVRIQANWPCMSCNAAAQHECPKTDVSQGNNRGRQLRRGACKPGSVMRAVCVRHKAPNTSPARAAIHLRRTLLHGSSNQPGRSRGETPLPCALRPGAPPLFGLAPGGVCQVGPCCHVPGALLPHPFTLACEGEPSIGGLLSVALSLGFGRARRCESYPRRAGVTRHPCFVEPGLSSLRVTPPRGCPAPRRSRYLARNRGGARRISG